MLSNLPPQSIQPLHPPRDQQLLRTLTRAMQRGGWQGRPVLVIGCNDRLVAWTGSHRIVAARSAGLATIPCYVVSEHRLLRLNCGATWGHTDDSERLGIVRRLDDVDALQLMWREGRE